MDRHFFLEKQILKFIDKSSNILVLGAEEIEYNIFQRNNYNNVTYSNIDIENLRENKIKSIEVDMNKIALNDNSYDYCVVNASIHHCKFPHQAILETFRVCKKGALIIEGNDSVTMKLATRLGFAEEFENSAIKDGAGGVNNSEIPNYIYRWNEREIKKIIFSFTSNKKVKFYFDYENNLENKILNDKIKNKIILFILKLIIKIFFIFFRKQQNLISIYLKK